MGITVNKLTNANVHFNGVGHAGKAEEVTLPVVNAKMVEHKGLGMIGALEVPAGLEKLTAKFKWSSLYPDVCKQIGNPYKAWPIQVRANLETYGAGGREKQVPVVAHLTGTFKNFPFGQFKHLDPAEFETEMAVTSAKLVVDGKTIYELDVLNNVWKVDGEDLLAAFNKNLGN